MDSQPIRRGRPATGQNTKVMRVPIDMDKELAMRMYYDWLPVIEEYKLIIADAPKAVRNERLIKMFEDFGIL